MMEYQKIGIVGHGFVGKAISTSFKKRNLDVLIYDKFSDSKEEGTPYDKLVESDLIFLCLPTPFVSGYGFDKSALHEACSELKIRSYEGPVLIKSTVEPGTCRELSEKYNLEIIHNPEFLTARTAIKDFEEQKHIVLGATLNSEIIIYPDIFDFYHKHFPEADISICSSEESEMMKLFCNSFYAIKIQAFNEFYLLCQKMNCNFEQVKDIMLRNLWINPMHTNVPGPDGKLSYGGLCFPKDTSALNKFMFDKGVPNEVLSACISEKNKMRKD